MILDSHWEDSELLHFYEDIFNLIRIIRQTPIYIFFYFAYLGGETEGETKNVNKKLIVREKCRIEYVYTRKKLSQFCSDDAYKLSYII